MTERPEKPDDDASASEIYEYLMEYGDWQQSQGAKKIAEMNEEGNGDE